MPFLTLVRALATASGRQRSPIQKHSDRDGEFSAWIGLVPKAALERGQGQAR